MLDINEIVSLTGLSLEKTRTLLPGVLKSIRDYTHRTFITPVSISGTIIIENGNIILPVGTLINIPVDSQIELRFSMNNRKIYTVKQINDNVMETHEKLFDEIFKGFIIKLSFNVDESIVAGLVKYKNTTIARSGVKSETLGSYNYVLDNIGRSHV